MPRVLLLVPKDSYRIEAFAAAAARVGAELEVATDRCRRLARTWGEPLALDFASPERAAARVVRRARTRPIDAVVATDDRSTVVAALAARALGLPANPPDAVAAARNKLRLRERLAASGLATPPYRPIDPGDGEKRVRAAGRAVGFPLVVKPLTLSASRGVIRADDGDQLVAAVARVRRILRTTGGPQHGEADADRLLIERFVPGPEVSIEGLLTDGSFETLAVFDKPDPLDGPFFEETIYVTPSRHPAPVVAALEREAAAAARAIGLVRGPVHAELRWDGPRAVTIEIAARTIGGRCSRTLVLGTGRTLEEIVLLDALGCKLPPHRRERRAAGVMMLPIPRAGLLRRVDGVERARAVPGIEGVEITALVDHELVPLPEGSSYLGFLFARGRSPAQVERALREAHRRLDVVITPNLAAASAG